VHVNDLLKIAVERGASDLHIKVGSYPMIRIGGALEPGTVEKRLDHEDVVAMSTSIMSTQQREKFKENFQRWQNMPPDERDALRTRGLPAN